MRFTTKLFLLLVLTSVVILSETACTQEKTNAENQALAQAKQATDAPQASDAVKVLISEVGKVSAGTKGNSIDFTFKLDGKETTFKEYTKNKVVFLNFWGTWCPPCRREIPDIIELDKDMKGKDFVIIGIPQERDAATASDKVKAYAEANGIPYLNIVDTKRALGDAYGGINAVPTTMLIDKKGKIAETIVGGQTKKAFVDAVARVLK